MKRASVFALALAFNGCSLSPTVDVIGQPDVSPPSVVRAAAPLQHVRLERIVEAGGGLRGDLLLVSGRSRDVNVEIRCVFRDAESRVVETTPWRSVVVRGRTSESLSVRAVTRDAVAIEVDVRELAVFR